MRLTRHRPYAPFATPKMIELERDHWNRLRERNNADEIQMYTLAQKVDEAFQVPEYEAYVCREKHDIGRAEAFEREMDAFHRRRILCMLEIFSHIDCSVLFQRHIELGHYWKSVRDYDRLRITAEQLGEARLSKVTDYVEVPVQPADILGSGAAELLARRRRTRLELFPIFEITAGNLKPRNCYDAVHRNSVQHFSDVMTRPVNG